MLLLNLIQVTESISGSVVPLAMFFLFFLFQDTFIPVLDTFVLLYYLFDQVPDPKNVTSPDPKT